MGCVCCALCVCAYVHVGMSVCTYVCMYAVCQVCVVHVAHVVYVIYIYCALYANVRICEFAYMCMCLC